MNIMQSKIENNNIACVDDDDNDQHKINVTRFFCISHFNC